ncbi:hypothetical protein H4I95_02893 [Botrytis cinerea]
MVKGKRWQSEEVAKLKEICSRQAYISIRGSNNPFWEMVAGEMETYGWNRQAHAIYFKWMRLNQPPRPKSSKKNSFGYGDSSDTEGEERGEEEIEDYEGETDTKSDVLFQIRSGDDASKPWAKGSNWSDEESEIAYQCIKTQRDKEKELKLEPITADQIWHMVAEALEQHQIYRKIPNIYTYWKNKGREKYNFDERTADAIEKSSRGIPRVRGGKAAQNSPGHAASKVYTWLSMPESSTEDHLQQNNSKAEMAMEDLQVLISPWQHDLLMVQYKIYNRIDNPVVNQLTEDTGLSREQIKLWYKYQRAMDAKEAKLQKEVELQTEELSTPILDEPELQSTGLKRYRVSDIGYYHQAEEEPAKRVRHSLGPEILMKNHGGILVDSKSQDKPEIFGRHSIVPEQNELSTNDVAISTIEVQQPSLESATQRNIPDSTSNVTSVMRENRELEQQKVHAAEEKYRELELAIIAHKNRADLELKAAIAKEQELTVQQEIREKATKRIAMIESFIDDY